MPIDIQCTACGQRLRVGDNLAGKQANCPKCKAHVSIPAVASKPGVTTAQASLANPVQVAPQRPTIEAAPTATAATVPAAPVDGWHLCTPDGQQYGPISKSELDSWLAEDRITADSQLLPPGAPQWIPATQAYPSLLRPAAVIAAQPQMPSFPSSAAPQFAAPAAMPAFAGVTSSHSNVNPYASPTAPLGESPSSTQRNSALMGMRDILSDTRPWLYFMAILGFIGVGFAIIGLLIIGLISLRAPTSARGAWRMLMLYFGFVSVMLYPYVCMFTYGQRIGDFRRTCSNFQFEKVLEIHRKSWRAFGIMVITVFVAGLLLAMYTFFSSI